ncbi:MAG: hypothetical protein Ct9H90mP9_3450 [Pseudomonadota bacterium]|nr:MAG: hypothetical protein Ct9H90mP9_3450 [Pseudomonadota bacterium]
MGHAQIGASFADQRGTDKNQEQHQRGTQAETLSMLFPRDEGEQGLEKALNQVCQEAEQAVLQKHRLSFFPTLVRMKTTFRFHHFWPLLQSTLI